MNQHILRIDRIKKSFSEQLLTEQSLIFSTVAFGEHSVDRPLWLN